MDTYHLHHSVQIIPVHLTENDQLTLPFEVKQYLRGIPQGRLEFVLESDKVYLRSVRKMLTIEDTYGFARPSSPVSMRDWQEEEQIAKDEHARHILDEMDHA